MEQMKVVFSEVGWILNLIIIWDRDQNFTEAKLKRMY